PPGRRCPTRPNRRSMHRGQPFDERETVTCVGSHPRRGVDPRSSRMSGSEPGGGSMAKIPEILQPHINTAFPANVCLVGSVLPNGFAQISPRGSTMVFDDTHIGLWERGKGSTNENLADGTPLTVYFRKPQLREEGVLPKGGIARFYGRARIYRS